MARLMIAVLCWAVAPIFLLAPGNVTAELWRAIFG